MNYYEFLLSKMVIAPQSGFDVDIPIMTFKDGTILKPHQRDGIIWAIKGGRRALFESFGLGKTIQQLLICKTIIEQKGGKALIVAPLGVRQEFKKDAKHKLGIEIEYIRNMSESNTSLQNIQITNYERVRDGDIDPRLFTVVTLDEASVLRSYGSKTYQTFLPKFQGVKYKFVCTATPSPNKYKELIHYAGYLEIMDTGQALTRFFQRDSTKANNLTLYPHKEKEFWLWMASWALFLTKPSDLGYDDSGYDMPEMKIIYHPVNVNHNTAGVDRDGHVKMFRDAALGLKDAAKEKRDSMPARIEKMKEIILNDNESNFVIWHDLEAERHEIMKQLPKSEFDIADVYGSLDYDIREKRTLDFADGKLKYLATKPSISGSGCNFQYHCHKAIFTGIGYEFNDFIQAVHRLVRYQQTKEVEINIIYAESEGEILKSLMKKWEQHNKLVSEMTNIIKQYGLSITNIEEKMKRSIGCIRQEVKGSLFEAVNNDTVTETSSMSDNSVDLIITSIPFANHYEYTPSYNDFGHTQNNDHFWEQMDYLTPELLRVVKPGRLACIHIKDRINFGNATGYGMPTCDFFHEETSMHFRKHGFLKVGMITVETDVVRENNQTYRLGWTENCKDGSKMGVGCPEYVYIFRKLPSDTSNAYADLPVVKSKSEYKRGRWQIDARAKWNSSGERFLTPEEIRALDIDKVNRYFSEYMKSEIYNFDNHIDVAIEMEEIGKLPATFETFKVPARYDYVWGDVNRMLTLNGEQSRKNLQMHVCPLQFDIVDRLITRYSNKGEFVYDPFGGLMTVPFRAMKLGRKGKGTELNPDYFRDGVSYCRAAEINIKSPTLFDLEELK